MILPSMVNVLWVLFLVCIYLANVNLHYIQYYTYKFKIQYYTYIFKKKPQI